MDTAASGAPHETNNKWVVHLQLAVRPKRAGISAVNGLTINYCRCHAVGRARCKMLRMCSCGLHMIDHRLSARSAKPVVSPWPSDMCYN